MAALAFFCSSPVRPAAARWASASMLSWFSCVGPGCGRSVWSAGSVLGMGSPTEGHGGEDGEDVGLQERHQHLEGGEEQQHAERHDPQEVEERLVRLGLE